MSKGSNTTTTQTMPDPVAMMTYYNMLGRAGGVANTPYEAFGGEEVAPINEQQTAGINAINANAGFAQPFARAGLSNIEQASGAVTPQDIAQYYDPYTNQVIGATQADFDVQNQRANSIVTGNAAAQGALGGDRVGVAQALTQEAQNRVQAPVIAGLRSSGFRSAEEMANAQKMRQLAGGAGEVTAATGAQSAGLQGAGAMVGAGTLQQQTRQAQDTQARMDYYQKQGYPFATAQWLAGIDTAVGSQLGGKGTTTGPAPNPWAQVAGLGIAAAGAFAKDGGRVRGFASGGIANPWGEAGQGWVPTIGLTGGAGAPKAPSPSKENNPFTKDSAKGLATLGKKATDWWNDPMASSQDSSGVFLNGDELGAGESTLVGGLGMMRGGHVRGYEAGGVPTSVGMGSFVDDDMPSDVVARRFPKELLARHITPINAQLRAAGERRLQEPVGELAEPSDPLGLEPRKVATERILPEPEPAAVAQQDVIPTAKTAIRLPEDEEPTGLSYAPRSSRAIVAPRGVAAQNYDGAEPPSQGEGGVDVASLNPLRGLSPEAKQGLISMGLGMMANRTGGPGSFLASMGEGGQQGMQTYASAKAATALQELQARKEAFEREKFNRPYSEMTARERELARHRQVTEGVPAGYRRGADGNLEAIPNGPADPSTVKTLADAKRGTAGLLDDDTIHDMAGQYLAGDKSVMQNLGRGAQGAENIVRLRAEISRQAREANMTPDQIATKMADFAGRTAAMRTLGTRGANVEYAGNTAANAIKLAEEASDKLPRTQFVPFNRMAQLVATNLSSPEQADFFTKTNTLVNEYARVTSGGTAQSTESQRQHARELLNTAQGPAAYKAVLNAMKQEIAAAKKAYQDTRKEFLADHPAEPTKSEPAAAPKTEAAPKEGPKPGKRVRQNGHTYEQQPDGSYKAID